MMQLRGTLLKQQILRRILPEPADKRGFEDGEATGPMMCNDKVTCSACKLRQHSLTRRTTGQGQAILT